MSRITRTERELLDLLSFAHIQLDKRGVPRVHRPITTEDENSDR